MQEETTQTNEQTPESSPPPARPPAAAPPVKSRVQARLDHELLKNYAELRREEHELITALADSLSRVDDLPEEQLEQVRNALFHTDYPFMMMMVGPFSSGKSTVINAILGKEVLEVGAIPTTDHIHILRYGDQEQRTRAGEITTVFYPSPLLENLSFVDTPGLDSVFDVHDKITRKFLHRADLVVLVMVATHVMAASDLNFLRELKDYGKRTIILINQIDLLEEEDRVKVLDFVREQARLHLGLDPLIWEVSARQGLEAQAESPRDEILYDESGMAEIEEYVLETLNDITRVKQKLETPLQIVSNVRKSAEELLRENQRALDDHRKTLENIETQITEAKSDQRQTVESYVQEMGQHWQQSAERGTEAIHELFQFSRAFRQVLAGLLELFGIAGLVRRLGGRTRAQSAFDKHRVTEPLSKIQEQVDKLEARLEGRDVKDLDNLVTYTRKRIEELPPNLKNKVIGEVQAPLGYDRSFLRRVKGQLNDIIQEASRFEIQKLDRQLTNTLIFVTLWELVVLGVALVGLTTTTQTFNAGSLLMVIGIILLAALAGLALLPIRGWMLKRGYESKIAEAEARFRKVLEEPIDQMLDYGAQLRRDAVAPFTRVIESQMKVTQELKNELDHAEQRILRVQRGISALK